MATEPNSVLKQLERMRAAADKQDAEVIRRIIVSYRSMYERLQADLELALRRAFEDGGEHISRTWLSGRLSALERQTATELRKFSVYLDTELHTSARAAMTAGSEQAASLMRMILGKGRFVTVNFNRLPVEAINAMMGFLSPASPLWDRLNKLAPYRAQDVADKLLDAIARGWNPRKAAGQLAGFLSDAETVFRDGMGGALSDALRMARTVQLYSYREATRANYAANSDVVTGWQWHTELGDGRACESCIVMHGTIHDLDEVLDDHYNGRAEVPGNVILAEDAVTLETLWYEGDIIVIRAASGKFLAVTPNHPVLTDRGWIAAQFVQIGDNVISRPGSDWASVNSGPNKKHIPTRVEDIPGAFDMVRLGSVPETAEDFYRKRIDGNIDVVFIDRLLWDGCNAALKQQVLERLFGMRNSLVSFAGQGKIDKGTFRSWFSAPGFLRGGNCGLSLFGTHPDIAEGVGFGHSMSPYSISGKDKRNGGSRNPVLSCQSVFGFPGRIAGANSGRKMGDFIPAESGNLPALDRATFGGTPKQPLALENIRQALFGGVPAAGGGNGAVPGEIILDRVVNVNVRRFSGHVYSLQTQRGWYYSNGIVSHNCAQIPIIYGQALLDETAGVDWFESQSEQRQQEILGPGKYEAWKDGKFELSQLSVSRPDDVYGEMRSAATLAELMGKYE
jgi:hypothetical protein